MTNDDIQTKSLRARAYAGQLGGLTTAATHDPRDPEGYTSAGLKAANGLQRFVEQTDPGLPWPERKRRAEAMRKRWYKQIGRKGGEARRRRK